MADGSYAGQQTYADAGSEFATVAFIVNSIMNRKATATLVQVKTVTNGGGAVAAVGFVDVQPMVNQLDGRGQPTPHGIIHNVPYFRLQGGDCAVIIDPKVGDIGLAVFASHDISSVKNNKAISNPGSRRRFSMADGLFLGAFLSQAPTNYIRFDSSGDIELKPAATVRIIGDLHATGTITADTDVIADTISGKTHTHGGVQSGSGTTDPPS